MPSGLGSLLGEGGRASSFPAPYFAVKLFFLRGVGVKLGGAGQTSNPSTGS